MIRKTIKAFCEDFTKIENYVEAIADTENTWDCHHRMETHSYDGKNWVRRNKQLSKETLVAWGLYYNVKPDDLVFLRKSDHTRLHNKSWKKGFIKRNPLDDATKKKISDSVRKTWKPRKTTARKVLCIETNVTYSSITEAENSISKGNVYMACKRGLRAGGLHWKFLDEHK